MWLSEFGIPWPLKMRAETKSTPGDSKKWKTNLMLVLPICVGGTSKKTSEGTFLQFGVAKLKHTQLAFKKRIILCLIRKRAENISKNKATFFLSSVIVVEVHFLRELFEKFLFQVESASF